MDCLPQACHGLFLVSPLGGQERKILERAQFSDYCWMPDGRRVLYASAGAPYAQTVDIQSGETQRVTELPHLQSVPFGGALAVSADGALIATGETDPASRDARIVIRRLGGRSRGADGDRFGPGAGFHRHPVPAREAGIDLFGRRSGPIPCVCIAVRSTAPASSVWPTSTTGRLPDAERQELTGWHS